MAVCNVRTARRGQPNPTNRQAYRNPWQPEIGQAEKSWRLPRTSGHRRTFDRHIRRLAWFALLASIVLLLPTVGLSASPALQLAAALGAVVLTTVVRTLIETVRGYVREQRMQAREAAEASRRSGGRMAAEAIQDRVGSCRRSPLGIPLCRG